LIMEKEKKKLLLVAVSVGVFLVIIISAAIIIATPKSSGTGTTFSSARPITAGPGRTQPASVDASEMVRNAGDIRGIQTPPSVSASQETNFYISGEAPVETIKSDGDTPSNVTINIPKPSTAAVPDTPAVSEVRPAPAASRSPAPAPAKPAAKPVAAPVPAVARPAAARPATSKTHNDYWVQTGAFTAKVRAEGVKETLASKGITSIIENREVEGKTWYRVRVGPYTSETEANYWLALVKSIEGFGDSQVRQTVSVR
jgi:DedD protein